jgi:GntR family transcriptional regulator, transcriptional repressor for pyruvate dehydrogenase complex
MTEKPPFQVVQTEKLSQQITRQLLETIIVGHYRPGELLPPERDLASMFQVSRAAVREALGTLAAKGFVSVRQGRGTTVNPPEDWNKLDPEVFLLLRGDQVFEELIEMRYIIEPEVAALAAVNITDEELEELRQVADLPDSDTVEQHVKRDTLFHLQITKATHNHILMMVLTSTYDLLSESRRRTFVVAGELPKARKWHEEIFNSIKKHDPAAAREAMQAHIQQVGKALQLYIEDHFDEKQEELT